MGEPLEVPLPLPPPQSSPASDLIDCWEANQSSADVQGHHFLALQSPSTRAKFSSVSGGPSSSSVGHPSSQNTNTTPRRTRHRVDAGEPRGCFNTVSSPFYNKNIFTPINSGPPATGAYPIFNNLGGHHHHHQHHHPGVTLGHHSSATGSSEAVAAAAAAAYYFQPMKMLSELISGSTTANGTNPCHSSGLSPSLVKGTSATGGGAHPQTGSGSLYPHPNQALVQSQHQLLLREMLQKQGNRSAPGTQVLHHNNNNNNTLKSGYEDGVPSDDKVKLEDKLEPPVPDDVDADLDDQDTLDEDESSGQGKTHKRKLEETDTVSEDGTESEVTEPKTSASSSSTGGGGIPPVQPIMQQRINGCKKRKLYQPQRTDFDDVIATEEGFDTEEENMDDPDDILLQDEHDGKRRMLPRRAARRMLQMDDGDDDTDSMRQDDFDDDGLDELESDGDKRLKGLRDSPDLSSYKSHLRSGSRSHKIDDELMMKNNTAPITRQLLTNVSSNGERSLLNNVASRPNNALTPELKGSSRVNVSPNGNVSLMQWKEGFKSYLLSHISDMIDSQFALLWNVNNHNAPLPSTSNNGNSPSKHELSVTVQPKRTESEIDRLASRLTPASQHKSELTLTKPVDSRLLRPSSQPPVVSNNAPATKNLLLNGGTVQNHQMFRALDQLHQRNRESASPELKKKSFPERSDYLPAFPRFNNNVFPGKASNNFSSELVRLSQGREMIMGQGTPSIQELMVDDGPLSLVVTPKKKRHKVTDTRLTPRAVSRLLGQVDSYESLSPGRNISGVGSLGSPPPAPNSMMLNGPSSLPTSVAIPNPGLSESRLFTPYAPFLHRLEPPGISPPGQGQSLIHPALLANPAEYVQQLREIHHQQQQRERLELDLVNGKDLLRNNERAGSAGSADSIDTGVSFELGHHTSSGTGNSGGHSAMFSCGSGHSSSTLTPMHLRKAKLMFFWVRYPSSAVLKMYFPDIKFNKNNTAQLVKWFSNFREFYYIQMEKYARQALSEGLKNSEDIHVSVDNELYRVLNLHYNRNNHIEVPSNFRYVVEQTLREFFKSVQTGKDTEQSWKKAIYKIIARMDDPVPEYFKSPNFLEQLE